MAECKHTPGPWIVGPFDEIWPASDVEICEGKWREKVPEPRIVASATKGNLLPNEDRANARLIAAAPELLEALKDCLDRWSGAFPGAGDYPPIQRAYAAVAKAEGRSHD